MKHNFKVTFILLGMFIVTQFIGLYVVNYYSPFRVVGEGVTEVPAPDLPFGLEHPEIEGDRDFFSLIPLLVLMFAIAISLFIFISKFKLAFVLRIWFFVVVVVALVISFGAFMPDFKYMFWVVLALAVVLAVFKIYKRDLLVHNFTELFIYPGIAAVFVPIFNLWTILLFLILISVYDVWAVWNSGIMQKMANYQIKELKVFQGFFVPYVSKKVREKIKKMKKSKSKGKKIRVNLAILGGGDVVFPAIASGVVLKTWGLVPSIFVIFGAVLGLSYLFFFAEKKKFYPAMLYITSGIFLGIGAGYVLRLIM